MKEKAPNESVLSEECRLVAEAEVNEWLRTPDGRYRDPGHHVQALLNARVKAALAAHAVDTARLRQENEELKADKDRLEELREFLTKELGCSATAHDLVRIVRELRQENEEALKWKNDYPRVLREQIKLNEQLAESERDHEQLVNYLTAKLGTKGEHSAFETIDNVAAKLELDARRKEAEYAFHEKAPTDARCENNQR